MSSLAIKQLIATLEEELQSSNGNSAIKARLDKLYAQRTADAKAVADAATASALQKDLEQKKRDKKMKINRIVPEAPAPPAGRTIKCCDCPTEFFFAQKEEELFAAEGMQPRKRCAPCLQAKKEKQPQPIELACSECKGTFIFSVGSQKHFAGAGWATPKRCHTCRQTKKVAHTPAPVPVPAPAPAPVAEETRII